MPRHNLHVLIAWLVGGLAAILSPSAASAADKFDADKEDRLLFQKFDTNGDGALSAQEIGVWPWSRYDKDGDGRVTLAEFLAGRQADRKTAQTEDNDDIVFKLLDWNDDGWLSGTELEGDTWGRYDTNGDGRVTRAEFNAGRAKDRAAKKGPAQPKTKTKDMPQKGGERKSDSTPKTGTSTLNLAGTYWQLLSMTTKNEKITDAMNPADVEFLKDGKWGVLHYSGRREAGTYTVKDDRLTMKTEDGVVYHDGKMTWKADTNILELDSGEWLMRLRKVKPK